MNISKAGRAEHGSIPDAESLACIREYTREVPEAEQLYVFPVLLCDNEIDRDWERFDEKTLADLAELFLGKTGICDHEWRSDNQVARIYRTELVRDPARLTADGRPYVGLKAWAYMLRTEGNAELIAQIEGGIRKEVSVGCSVAKRYCSICGEPEGQCGHVKGEEYGGKRCFFTLSGAVDAYEWSFVAVPAQRGAGVTKALNADPTAAQRLQKEAALGREYLSLLRRETKRLALLCGKEFHDAMAPAVECMEADALRQLQKALEEKAAEKLPLRSQFPDGEKALRFDGAAYKI